MTRKEESIRYFRNSFNCAQSVLSVYHADFNLPEDTLLRIATAFGGGIGRQQLTCGAVTGAIMAIGLKYGKGSNDSDENKKETYRYTLHFFNEFKKRHGSANCRELLEGLDMHNPDDMNEINRRDMFHTHCEKYVGDAVEIAGKIIGIEQ